MPLALVRLSPADRELIGRRYAGKTRAEELMREFATSRRRLFRKLDHIRR